MQYREVDILAKETVADSGTKSIDLDVTDPVTELSVGLDLTNGAADVAAHNPTAVITKIEIVDGGTVYASLTGEEVAAIYAYRTGRYPPHWYSETLSEGQWTFLPLRFGRFLGDPLRSFNPAALRNPQLKVTWAKHSQHLTGTIQLTVKARLLSDVAPAPSCLFPKAVRTFTTAGSGVEHTELPTDYPIRTLFVRMWLSGVLPNGALTNFKLDCDAGRFIAFDMSGNDMKDLVESIYPHIWVRQFIEASNADQIQTWMGAAYAGSGAIAGGAYKTQLWCSGNPYAVIYGSDYNNAAFDDQKVEINAMGSLPHNTFAYPFGLPEDPATWFNVAAYRKVDLQLTQAESGGECSILVEQDRPL